MELSSAVIFFFLITQKPTFPQKESLPSPSSLISSQSVLLAERGLASEIVATNYTVKIIPLRKCRPNFISLRQSPDAPFMCVLKPVQ